MEQELQKRYRVLFIDSDFERYFEHSWDAVKYAALNNGIVYDQDADRIIASYAMKGDEL